MAEQRWTKKQLQGFHAAAQSLKLYRRAELEHEGTKKSLISSLYVDPLPSDHVLEVVLKPNTTFLIGRKGTGKSTIFQRAQHELLGQDSYAAAYVDIKTVYESSATDPELLQKFGGGPTALPPQMLERLLLYRAFLRAVITAIKEDLKARLKESFWIRIKNKFSGTVDELFESLDSLLEDAASDEFVSVVGVKQTNSKSTGEHLATEEAKGSASLHLNAKPALELGGSLGSSTTTKATEETSYGDILMRVFNIKEMIARLKGVLDTAGVRRLYIFVDDFSELPEEAMRVVVDSLLAPLNNWSDELIKFKVAAYPGRIYYGQIDKTKIDEIALDLFSLYGTTDVSDMEEKGIDFTRRLIERRLEEYCGSSAKAFLESEDASIWRQLFYATLSNPRTVGYILFYLYESHLIYQKRIGSKAIRDAAQRYYDEKILPYFSMNHFLHETFDEKASVLSLRELLETMIRKQRDLKKHRESAVMRDISGTPPTSHFHIAVQFESLLSTLELNFFVTKYYEMSDRDSRKVAVYALNYGLCQKYAIEFGRPVDKREQRLYFVERIFDATSILKHFIQTNQEIRCDHCGETIELEKLEMLKHYDMQCFKCKTGRCAVVNLSKKFEQVIAGAKSELLLPVAELGILQTLESEKRPMFAAEIAAELDRSYQLIGKRGKTLAERGLVLRKESENRRIFEITELAEKTYFVGNPGDGLNIDEEAR
jgi:DNA-binding transcriptional ArsR family regulator